ncbi:hypothetical protein [Saccharicrinis aurantiacus]|uniref:hypothetical protein n=1 Tax=Saccharicrinis aurantiacus TaxID=1849719 RepID=UPI000838EFCB|nr:hypothetical protein [Saccharicrinis aurantiacus]
MKYFYKNCLTFGGTIFIFGIILEIYLRALPNDFKIKKEFLEKPYQNTETLIFGTSHAYYGLNPTLFKHSCFNASYISQTLNYDWEILNKYSTNFESLEQIIITISYASLFEILDCGVEKWRIKNYNIYYGIHTSKQLKFNSELIGNKLFTNLKRFANHIFYNEYAITSSELGWGTNYGAYSSENLEKTGYSAAKRHTVSDFQYLAANKQTLLQFVDFCNRNKIRLLLLTTPTSKYYYEHLDNSQLDRMQETIQELKSIGDLDYLNLLKDNRFTNEDFYDADHLNKEGSIKLSNIITDYINP